MSALYYLNKSKCLYSGQLISDNILAAYETLHSMQTRHWGKTGYVAVKLDMSKTNNRVE